MVLFHLFFLQCTTIRPKIMVHIDFVFICTRSLYQKLGSSLIQLFSLSTTIRPKIRIFINLFFLSVHDHSTKNQGPHSLFFFICTQPFDQSQGSLLLFNLFFFLIVAIFRLVYLSQYFPYISFAYFVLYSWRCCSYISHAKFMAI